MIVADTTVWIDFLKARQPVSRRMRNLLENGQILAVECIFGELLQGARGKREREIISDYWRSLPKHSLDGMFLKAGADSSQNKWIDKGVGLIDCAILMCARATNSQIWTLDKKLLSILQREEIFS